MTSEARTLFLGVLTLVIYAASIFISEGALIFPFPLNEFIFLAIAAQFFYLNRTGNKWAGLLSVFIGIFGVLSTQFFWTFFFSQKEMIAFMDGLTTDYCLLASYLFILIGGIATMIKQKKGVPLLLSGFFILAFIAGVMLNHP
ncbi:MAG: hypothetical protein AB8B56_07675, partial [Crocinitomicaceae bacterium]